MNKQEITGLKHLNHSKAFVEYPNDMDDIDKNIEDYSPNKKRSHSFYHTILFCCTKKY